MKFEEMQLGTLCGGAAAEQFLRELQRVVANIDDPNCEARVTRTINMKIAFHPGENRDSAGVTVTANATLAPHRGSTTTAFFSRAEKGYTIAEHNPKQMTIGEALEDEEEAEELPDGVEKIDDHRREEAN